MTIVSALICCSSPIRRPNFHGTSVQARTRVWELRASMRREGEGGKVILNAGCSPLQGTNGLRCEMDFCLDIPAARCLYTDLSTNCTYYSKTNFTGTPIPEGILASIHSSTNCSWLESIISGNYTTQNVWRDLLPATIYEPNSTNCYGQQYLDYFNLSSVDDQKYSDYRDWLIPRGLSSLADSCMVKTCQKVGATGNPDTTGIGVSQFSTNMSPTPRDIS